MPVIYFVDGPADGRKEVLRTRIATGDRYRVPVYRPICYHELACDGPDKLETADYQLTEIEDGVFTALHVP